MKKYSFALIAVVFALACAFAFKPTLDTFQFSGVSTDPDERVDPLEYTLSSPTCGATDVTLCAITATKDGNDKPVIVQGDGSGLYEALLNGRATAPNFLHASIDGKNP